MPFRKILALGLVLGIGLPCPAFALRQQHSDSQTVKAGLERRLTAGLETIRLSDQELYDLKTLFQHLALRSEDVREPLDVLIVLGSPDYEATGHAAAEAYMKFKPQHVVATGKGARSVAEGELLLQLLVQDGVPSESVTIDIEADDLGQNAQFSARLLAQKQDLLHRGRPLRVGLVPMALAGRIALRTFQKQFHWDEGVEFHLYPPDPIPVTAEMNPAVLKPKLDLALAILRALSENRDRGFLAEDGRAEDLSQPVVDAAARLKSLQGQLSAGMEERSWPSWVKRTALGFVGGTAIVAAGVAYQALTGSVEQPSAPTASAVPEAPTSSAPKPPPLTDLQQTIGLSQETLDALSDPALWPAYSRLLEEELYSMRRASPAYNYLYLKSDELGRIKPILPAYPLQMPQRIDTVQRMQEILGIQLAPDQPFVVRQLWGEPIFYIVFQNNELQGLAFDELYLFVEARPGFLGMRKELAIVSQEVDLTGGGGMDFRLSDMARFFSERERRGLPLNDVLARIKQELLEANLLIPQGSGYISAGEAAILSTGQHASEADVAHEINHGIYFTDAAYRGAAQELWSDLSDSERKFVQDILAVFHYSEEDPDLILREFIAFFRDAEKLLKGYLIPYGDSVLYSEEGQSLHRLRPYYDAEGVLKPAVREMIQNLHGRVRSLDPTSAAYRKGAAAGIEEREPFQVPAADMETGVHLYLQRGLLDPELVLMLRSREGMVVEEFMLSDVPEVNPGEQNVFVAAVPHNSGLEGRMRRAGSLVINLYGSNPAGRPQTLTALGTLIQAARHWDGLLRVEGIVVDGRTGQALLNLAA